MIPLIPYASVTPGSPIDHAKMNLIYARLDAVFNAIFGGKSFILGWNLIAGTQLPANLFGKRFWFTNGTPTAYAQTVPGAPTYNVSVPDTVAGGNVNAVSVHAYNHSVFTTAEAAAVAASYDTVKHIATVQKFGGAFYNASVPAARDKVSIFEHSLAVHTRQLQGPGDLVARTYWLREGGTAQQASPVPEKRYEYGQAEIIIEGPNSIALPAAYDKYGFFRFHNLNPFACLVQWPGGNFTLQPFECRCVRRSWNAVSLQWDSYRAGDFRYWHTFESGDPRFFWSFASTHGAGLDDNAVTADISHVGNNITNPSALYEFIKVFTDPRHHAHFVRDPHELADIGELFLEVTP